MKQITNKGSTANWSLVSILIFSLIMIPAFLQAKEIGEQEVRSAVETWVRHVTADARPDAVIERMEPHKVNGETVAYIAHLMDGGFCLCGADDLVAPVYLYCPQGTYYKDNSDCQDILWEIETRVKYLQEGLQRGDPKLQPYQQALSERAAYWEDLIAGRIPIRMEDKDERAEPDSMELNLTTRWTQGYPYYNFCPIGFDNDTCVVGCVATAMAQIMRYWNYPASGTGSHTYWWDGDDSCDGPVGAQWLSATFSDAYDWANMPDTCPTAGCTPDQQNALAELCYEAGVALEMDYGACGSGASTARVAVVIDSFFRYDRDAEYISPKNLDLMVWDIQWLRPFQLRGTRHVPDTAGHSWVIFGYNKRTSPWQFKMNLGWGGNSGWYSCDDVPQNFVIDHAHVVMIAPLSVYFVGGHQYGDGSPNNPCWNIEKALEFAPDNATLIFKAGSVNYFYDTNTLVIDRPFTLRGKDVVIRKY